MEQGSTCQLEQTALIRIVSILRLCGVSRLAKEASLPEKNVVFVVDDDPAMLRSLARLLRQFGYDSLLFPSAEAFTNHNDFATRLASFSISTSVMCRVSTFDTVLG